MTTLRLPAPYRLARGKRNPIAAWLDGLGLFGLRSHEKFIPDGVFSLPKEQVGAFHPPPLGHRRLGPLGRKAGQGSDLLRLDQPPAGRRPGPASPSLQHLQPDQDGEEGRLPRLATTSYIYGVENQLRFCDEIGVHGARG